MISAGIGKREPHPNQTITIFMANKTAVFSPGGTETITPVKLAGAVHRHSRGGLLHQGSVAAPAALADVSRRPAELLARLVADRYAHPASPGSR